MQEVKKNKTWVDDSPTIDIDSLDSEASQPTNTTALDSSISPLTKPT